MQFNKRMMYVLVAASGTVPLGAIVDEARAQSQCQANELAKLLASDGAAADYFGSTVAIDGDTAVIGAPTDDDNGTDSGSAYVFHFDGSSWVQQAKLLPSDGAANDRFSAQVIGISADTIVIGAPTDDDNGTDSGSAYVFEKPPEGWADMTETAKLTASDGAAGDNFGVNVDSSDGTVVIGAGRDDDNGWDSGSAYVFVKPAGGWVDMTETAKLTASDGAPDDLFGSVAISGDTIVVGAHRDDGRRGAAYVFVKPAGGWVNMTETAKLTASDRQQYDIFGVYVAVWGDTVVAGAYESSWGTFYGPGSAYVFEKPPGGWVDMTETAKLLASDGAWADAFGYGVALWGDTIVIGAQGDDDNGSVSGSAYVFQKPPGGWANMTETAKLTASDAAAGDAFGYKMAIYDDTALIGAVSDDDNGTDSGSVYVFRGLSDCNSNGALDICDIAQGTSQDTNTNGIPDECEPQPCQANELAKLLAADGAPADYFGVSVAIDGDTAVMVASADDDNGTDSGSAYAFHFDGSSWVQQAKLLPSDGAASDRFGAGGIGISGDTVVIGVYGDDDNGTDSGSAYVFEKPPGGWADMTETAKLTASDGAAGDHFGYPVAISGDTVVIGASNDDDNGTSSGSAYVFVRPAGGWVNTTETAKLTASDGAAGDMFGVRGATISGDTVVVGAALDDGRRGSAYVFEKPAGGWVNMTETAKLTASDREQYDLLGFHVAVWGDTVVAGAQETSWGTAFGPGSAYVFVKPPGGWVDMTETAKLLASDGAWFDIFGWSVAIRGDTVVVGALGDDDNGSVSGSAYVFRKPPSGWANMTETAKLTASDGAAGDGLGFVAMYGDTAVIGANADDDNGTDSGSVYVFRGLGDCNTNGTLDICDIAEGTSADGNTNGIPDECEDADGDGILDEADNCPGTANAWQSDVDTDGAGDLCDLCPGDPADGCNPSGSVAKEIAADEGGTISTPDDVLTLDFDPGDLAEDTTISITQTDPQDPEVDLMIGPSPGLGKALAVYDLEPDGLAFNGPVTLTIVVDVTDLNAKQREKLTLYQYTDTDGDGVEDAFVEIPGTTCTIVEDPPGTFTGTLTTEVDHFCLFAVVAPLDTDNDGLPDLFPPEDEAAYGTDPLNPDTDGDGLLDWTEVDMALGSGCPNPVNADSDGDTLTDGQEVDLGTDPCNSDTDGDGIHDGIDPYPTDPGGTSGYLEDQIRALASFITDLDLGLFTGPNDNANRGRRNALSNRANAAANELRAENYAEAIDVLSNLLSFVDGVEPPPDWIGPCPERDDIVSSVNELIELLGYLP